MKHVADQISDVLADRRTRRESRRLNARAVDEARGILRLTENEFVAVLMRSEPRK